MNTPFLQYVADDLRQKFHNDLSRTAVIFPNKRAGIFFSDYLSPGHDESPVWSPAYMTIGELFDRLSPLLPADDIRTVCLLYRIYREETGLDISLDYFYSWAQQLLADFDNVDKSMADARRLFTNLSDAKRLEALPQTTLDLLRPLIETHQRQSVLRDEFEEQWSKLYAIYQRLSETLANEGTAYEGARFRKVIEELEEGTLALPDQFDHYVFVGFHLLLTTEDHLFRYLQEQGKALFYWDYDCLYCGPDAAIRIGHTLENNMKKYPGELSPDHFDHLAHLPEIDFVAASSATSQARYASDWTRRYLTREEERRTAIILCDETLLQPLLHSLPDGEDGVQEVNVTKGFPMSATQAFADVTRFFDSEKAGRPHLEVLQALAHQIEETARIHAPQDHDDTWTGQLFAESYFQCFTTVTRFIRMVTDSTLSDISLPTLRSLIMQVLRGLSIPFHGEPATGLQVMGMLETRGLDFDHVLMLSVGEGILPKVSADHSFIPYDLRKAYGLTTGEDQSAIYAYNFFRLLQRAGHVTLVYDESTDGLRKGEMSRFMIQLLVTTDLPIHFFTLRVQQHAASVPAPDIRQETARILMSAVRKLSPSAIEKYIDCPLKFYFSSLAHLAPLEEDNIILAANTFGSILHDAAHRALLSVIRSADGSVSSERLRLLAKDDAALTKLIQQAFLSVLPPSGKEEPQDFRVLHPVEANVIRDYLRRLLLADASLQGLRIQAMEQWMDSDIGAGITIGGQIDRIDTIHQDGSDVMRVVDYKTGNFQDYKVQTPDIETLFKSSKLPRHYIFQTFLYSLLCTFSRDVNPAHLPIVPTLLFMQKLQRPDHQTPVTVGTSHDKTPVTDFASQYADEYSDALRKWVLQMKDRALTSTDNADICQRCDFRLLCNR